MTRSPHRSRPFLGLLLAVAASLAATACQDQPAPVDDPVPPSVDVVMTFGHGTFLGAGGATLAAGQGLFERTQRAYLDVLRRGADALGLAVEAEATRARIADEVDDDFLANALLIDWLIEQAPPAEHATMKTVNAAMRNHYLDTLATSPADRAERRRTKGVGGEAARRLEGDGISALVTYNTGEKYINECAANGVPIPPPMYRTPAWTNLGVFDRELIDEGKAADLWMYRSTSPAGVCLALPRYYTSTDAFGNEVIGDDASVMGLICLSTVTNKACFWDSPNTVDFRRNVEVPMNQFVGGFDLEANGQGTCSDCHSGENPFVVHPDKLPFQMFRAGGTFGTGWYEPIVHPNWPQNPGPTRLLDAVSSARQCDGCHDAGREGGRFPAVSRELAGYCEFVLARAALDPSPKRTMPRDGMPDLYTTEIEALRTACGTEPVKGKVVPLTTPLQDASFLSPPMVIDPLYGCAEQVAVRGAVLNATVTLSVNGTTYQKIARDPGQVAFTVSPPLQPGDLVSARQKLGGMTSGPSATVTVRDHHVDYPGVLPAPEIDPALIYSCAEVIAVRHVPGAKLTVWVDGGSPVTAGTSTGWTAIAPGRRPFVVGDQFTAQISMCPGEPPSPISAGVRAVAAPSILPAPTFDPPRTFPGQELVSLGGLTNGSMTRLKVSGVNAGGFTTPISWMPNYDLATALGRPLALGDTVSAQQSLCAPGPITTLPPTSKCSDLPAPRIERALPGARHVVMASAIPGARIHVYDATNAEIGDGSGTVIALSRALVGGDVLTVVQQLGSCTSATAHRLAVQPGGQ